MNWSNPSVRRAYHKKYWQAYKHKRLPEAPGARQRRKAAQREHIQLELPFAMTHAEIAEELGISEVRVGQIERQALRKLREAYRARGIRNSAELILPTHPSASEHRLYAAVSRCHGR